VPQTIIRRLIGSLTLAIGLIMGTAVSADDTKGVKIGILGEFSSIYSSVGGQALLEAAKMAVEDFGGQVLGKPIEVVSGDAQLRPDIASTIARQWFDQDNVDVIADMPSTNVTLAVAELANERKRVLLSTSASSSVISGEKCSPYVAQWTYDTYSNASALGKTLISEGAKNWFILATDSVTGTVQTKDVTNYVTAHGGKIVGTVRAPIDATDYSSFLVQAQSANADMILIGPGGAAGVSVIKQANEFGLVQAGIKLASITMQTDDVKAAGLQDAQKMYFVTAFVWDKDDETKAFSERFLKRTGKKPNMNMVGTYSAVLHYLKAVQAAGTKDADAVMAKMREMPINDVFTHNGILRKDGRMAHSTYVVQVKTPAESTGEWDLYKLVKEIPVEEAVRPVNETGCPLVK
jgi:branched-chain amino acid transport system substrate-binding protein